MADVSVSVVLAQQLDDSYARQPRDVVAAQQALDVHRLDAARQAQTTVPASQLNAEQRHRDRQLEDDLRRQDQNHQIASDQALQAVQSGQSVPRGAVLDVIA